MPRLTRALVALAATLATLVVLATPAAAAPQYFTWRWIDCPTMTVGVQIDNLSNTGYRYQILTTHYSPAGTNLGTDTSRPWIPAHDTKITLHGIDTVDETIRSKVTRGHYEWPGGWQTWVNDQLLMDLTTPAC